MKTPAFYKVFGAAFIILLAALFIIPMISLAPGSIVTGTLDDIGAQEGPFSLYINTLLVFLALSSLRSGWEFYAGFFFHKTILVLFSISLGMTAIFNQAPAGLADPSSFNEDAWHHFFSGTLSLSFIILSIATALIKERRWERDIAAASGLLVLIFTVLMYRLETTAGIWNRLMIIIIFGWMLLTFRKI